MRFRRPRPAPPIGVALPDVLGGYTVTIDAAGAIRCRQHGDLLSIKPGDTDSLDAAIQDHARRWHPPLP
jgi:hypothetical protein